MIDTFYYTFFYPFFFAINDFGDIQITISCHFVTKRCKTVNSFQIVFVDETRSFSIPFISYFVIVFLSPCTTYLSITSFHLMNNLIQLY